MTTTITALRRFARQAAEIPRGCRADVLIYQDVADRAKGGLLDRGGDLVSWPDALRQIQPGQVFDVFIFGRYGSVADDHWELLYNVDVVIPQES
jgi:hypothetical protein